jgi:hypothetical protein
MARPVRPLPQTQQAMLMPHTQYEAPEAHCQAQLERGADSDKSTVKDNDDNDITEEAEDPQEDPALVKTRISKDSVNIVRMSDCCLECIQPCKCKGEGR